MLRVIFFGTPTFAVPTLDALLTSPHEVVAVVTQPDRPSGRGQHMTAPPVKTRALAAGLPCWQPERLKTPEFLAQVSTLAPDVG
ncbi:MAG: methionyl-tRNA formyltransferase, partial [Vicinamibacterales bacterium]